MSDIEPDPHATFLEYVGIAGATKECQEAIERLLMSGADLRSALILTCQDGANPDHAFFLTIGEHDELIVKSGFSSGYGGAGPVGLSAVLDLLHWHDVELDEAVVDVALMARLDASAPTLEDLKTIRTARRVRPTRFWDYIVLGREEHVRERNPWKHRGLNVPMAIIDDRLAEMARDFWRDPDGMLFKGHRLLEETVRDKAGITVEEASKGPSSIYAVAFNGEAPRLSWPGISRSEQAGRTNIFVGAVSAYRNVRAHRTDKGSNEDRICELLLLNQLFRLEAATVRAAPSGQNP